MFDIRLTFLNEYFIILAKLRIFDAKDITGEVDIRTDEASSARRNS